jgi:hypothetical protein
MNPEISSIGAPSLGSGVVALWRSRSGMTPASGFVPLEAFPGMVYESQHHPAKTPILTKILRDHHANS